MGRTKAGAAAAAKGKGSKRAEPAQPAVVPAVVEPGPAQERAQERVAAIGKRLRALLVTEVDGKEVARIDSEETNQAVAELFLELRDARDGLYESYTELIAPLNKTRDRLLELRRNAVANPDAMIDTTKRVLGEWDQRQRREREERERQAREEQQRLERERQAEADRLRKEQEAQLAKARDDAAAKAEAEGDTTRAEIIRQVPLPEMAPPVVEAPPPLPPAPAPARPATPGLGMRQVWVFEITDPASVKREFCVPDEKRIRKVVEAMGLQAVAVIGGITVRQESVPVRQ